MHICFSFQSSCTRYSKVVVTAALVMLTGAFRTAPAKSIAESLADYRKETSITSVSGATGTSFSGVALNHETGKLYVVDNANANIYVLSLTGTVERTITTRNLNDPESICHLRDNTFFIASEGSGSILRVEIPPTGTGPLSVSGAPSFLLGSGWGNNGIEGVSYCTTDNTLYVVKEINPSELFRITLDERQMFVNSFANDPFNISDRQGDAADIAALNDGNFIIVNQESNRIEGFGPTGESLSTFSVDMVKPEGIAIDTTDGTIYLVGEPREFCVLKPTTASVAMSPASRPDFDCSISLPGGFGKPYEATITLPVRSPVAIESFTPDGKRFSTVHSVLNSGSHRIKLGATFLTKGIYFFRITAGTYQRAVSMLL